MHRYWKGIGRNRIETTVVVVYSHWCRPYPCPIAEVALPMPDGSIVGVHIPLAPSKRTAMSRTLSHSACQWDVEGRVYWQDYYSCLDTGVGSYILVSAFCCLPCLGVYILVPHHDSSFRLQILRRHLRVP